ncbi:MAG TPA: 50S ribosomal protein L29 [candidate division Zixibacteria bacterium]|nr:50S ribosomal protein L29 [candidate division Zixibacteria bacterium]
MASIVELRDIKDEKLEEMLDNGREELFNLRFQQASARLDDLSQIKRVRREIAQLETVLNQRDLAVKSALAQPNIVAEVAGQEKWSAEARFKYEQSVWEVVFFDGDDNELVTTTVNLNKKKVSGRRARRSMA